MDINALLNPKIEEETKDVEMVDTCPSYLHATDQKAVSPPSKKPKKPKNHSNKVHIRPHVHWTRYQKVDLNHAWNDIKRDFKLKFPERPPGDKGLNTMHYRDNSIPRIDQNGSIVCDASGKALSIDLKIRDKYRIKFKEKFNEAPCSFIERHPWAALEFEWVSAEHKQIAARIVAGIERTHPSLYTQRQQLVVTIRQWEAKKESSRQEKRERSLAKAAKAAKASARR